jgi:hypothetical protein
MTSIGLTLRLESAYASIWVFAMVSFMQPSIILDNIICKYLIIYKVHFEKPTAAQIVRIFLSSCEILRYITVFVTVRHS